MDEEQNHFDPLLQIKHEPELIISDVVGETNPPTSGDESLETVSIEIRRKYNFNKKLACNLCQRKYSTKSSLNAHVKTHGQCSSNKESTDPSGEINNSYCQICYKNVRGLSYHLSTFHSDVWYPCKLCSFKTKYTANLVSHQRKHSLKKQFSCPHCDKMFNDQSNKNRHVRKTHKKVVNFECHICSTSVTFNRYDNLTLHLKRIHGFLAGKQVPDVLHCDHCSVTYLHKSSLIRHLKSAHFKAETKPMLKCSVCSQEFIYKLSLIDHLNGVHLKKFCCRFCCKTLTTRKTLETHEASGKCQH